MSDDQVREFLLAEPGCSLVRLDPSTIHAVRRLCEDVLRLRQEVATLRAERDAAVAAERERCAPVGFDVTLELEVSVANGHFATLERKLRLPVPPSEDVVLFLDGDHDSFEITNIHWFEKGNLLHCTVGSRKDEGDDLDAAIAYYKTNGWTVEHVDRRGQPTPSDAGSDA